MQAVATVTPEGLGVGDGGEGEGVVTDEGVGWRGVVADNDAQEGGGGEGKWRAGVNVTDVLTHLCV